MDMNRVLARMERDQSYTQAIVKAMTPAQRAQFQRENLRGKKGMTATQLAIVNKAAQALHDTLDNAKVPHDQHRRGAHQEPTDPKLAKKIAKATAKLDELAAKRQALADKRSCLDERSKLHRQGEVR